jgi:hypothetical protein
MNLSKEVIKSYALLVLKLAGEVGAPVIFAQLSGDRRAAILDRAENTVQYFLEMLFFRAMGMPNPAQDSELKFKLYLSQTLLQLGVAEAEMEDKLKALAVQLVASVAGRFLA